MTSRSAAAGGRARSAALAAGAYLLAAACGTLVGGALFVTIAGLPALMVHDVGDDTASVSYIAADLLLYVAPIAGTLVGIISGVCAASAVRRRITPRRV